MDRNSELFIWLGNFFAFGECWSRRHGLRLCKTFDSLQVIVWHKLKSRKFHSEPLLLWNGILKTYILGMGELPKTQNKTKHTRIHWTSSVIITGWPRKFNNLLTRRLPFYCLLACIRSKWEFSLENDIIPDLK